MLSLLSLNIARHLDASKFVIIRHDEQFLPGFPLRSSAPSAFYADPAHHRRSSPKSLRQPAAASASASLPQAVVVEEAAQEDLNEKVEYWVEKDNPEVASNAIVVVDAATQ